MLASDILKDIEVFRVVLVVRVSPVLVMTHPIEDIKPLIKALARMPADLNIAAEFRDHDTLEIGA